LQRFIFAQSEKRRVSWTSLLGRRINWDAAG
jgi:hypothetical protein